MRHWYGTYVMLGALAAPVAAQTSPPRGFAAAPDVQVRLVNLVGLVRVVGWDRDSVAVSGALPPDAGELVMRGTRDALMIGVERPAGSEGYAGATLEVRVPRGVRLVIKAVHASLSISGVVGDIDAGLAKGRLQIEGAPRSIVAETITGNIECDGPARSVRLRSLSGDIIVRGSAGDLAATTVTGRLSIGGALLRHVRLESTAGTIDVKGRLAADGLLDVQTHSGDIALRLPPTLSASLEASADAGRFRTDFPGVRTRLTRGTPLKQTLDGGRGTIRVRTFTGVVELQQQP